MKNIFIEATIIQAGLSDGNRENGSQYEVHMLTVVVMSIFLLLKTKCSINLGVGVTVQLECTAVVL